MTAKSFKIKLKLVIRNIIYWLFFINLIEKERVKYLNKFGLFVPMFGVADTKLGWSDKIERNPGQ
jgi:hypothetical protein